MKKALILSGGGARGAFQVGVWKYLQEINWRPDLICGTSIGAVNATAIGSGMPVERLVDLWRTHNRSAIYRLNALRFVGSAVLGKPLKPILDTTPLRNLLVRHLDIRALRRSPMEIIISAVHLATGRLHLYNQDVIEVDHVMASSAMPILFPWQSIGGQIYWDGGVMANTPLFMALERRVEEIVVVLLSPVGQRHLPAPTTLRQGLEMVLEHFLLGSYQTLHPLFNSQSVSGGDPWWPARPHLTTAADADGHPKITVVAPPHMLGFASLLNFSSRQVNRLIRTGYQAARRQLGNKT